MKAGLAVWVLVCVAAAHAPASAQAPASAVRSYTVAGDSIPASLTGQAGDAARGALLLQQRQKSLCVLCHSGPFPDAHLQGNIAPDLAGVGSRLSVAQLRLRIVDMKRLNPQSIMPAYYAAALDREARVAAGWRGKPILAAEEIEDLVAYLQGLKQ
jgi:sulfur-oxidizing protein SoxX